jgi:hypothetical protein
VSPQGDPQKRLCGSEQSERQRNEADVRDIFLYADADDPHDYKPLMNTN